MSKFKIGDKVTAINRSGIWEIIETNTGKGKGLYLCYQKGFYGHNGKGCSNKFRQEGKYYSTIEYWYFSEINLRLYKENFLEIRIVTDGKHTTAAKFVDGEKVKEATVTLYYKDKFDFNIGAQEALKKLNNKPHLQWLFNRENIGEIGELTNQTAIFGEKLYIGDVVQFCIPAKKTYGIRTSIVCGYSGTDVNPFVMGLANCEFINGICGKFQLRKIKSYTELKNGEIINNIKVIM